MSARWMLWQKNGDLLPTEAVCKCAGKCEAGSHPWPQGQQLKLPSRPSTRSRARKAEAKKMSPKKDPREVV